MYPWWSLIVLPYTRFEAPGSGQLMRVLCRAKPSKPGDTWHEAPTRLARGKLHGYLMRLDLRDWCQRTTFFLGRYYELEVQMLVQAVLRPADRFVDIGANIGMLTLLAARCVGPSGRVDSFEPNPACLLELRQHLAINGIEHVRVHAFALSDNVGRLTLNLADSHTGTATLAPVLAAIETVEVEVRVGDFELAGSTPIRAIKIDVEGFELNVLRGLAKTLASHRPLLITEFIENHFARAGTSGRAIEDFLRGASYLPYRIATRRRRLSCQLTLTALSLGQPMPSDVIWIHRESDALDAMVAAGHLAVTAC